MTDFARIQRMIDSSVEIALSKLQFVIDVEPGPGGNGLSIQLYRKLQDGSLEYLTGDHVFLPKDSP